MTKKRDRLQVIHDILKTISDKSGRIKPTHVLYKSNLSHQMMDEYLGELKEKNFVSEKLNGKSKFYAITEKGRAYLDQYKLILNFTESFGLD